MKKKIAVLTSGWSIDYLNCVIEGLKKSMEKRNIDIYIFTCYKFNEPSGENNITSFAVFDLIDYKDFDGVIIMPNLFNDEERVEHERKRIVESGVPAVSLCQPLEGLHFVNSDNHDSYKNMIVHLIKQHYLTDFAYIGGPDGNAGADSNFRAYKEALEENGIPVNDKDVYLHGDWSYDFAYKKANEILTSKKIPQAIVCVNDWAAMATTKAALQLGISVPEELVVIGFDDISYAKNVIPSISTVNIRAELLAETAVDLLLKKQKELVTVNIKAEEKYRQSCGCISDIRVEQIKYSQGYFHGIDDVQRFASQLRHMEDIFIQNQTVVKMKSALQNYFERRHTSEGSDFAILIKDEVIQNLIDVDSSLPESTTYGEKMRIVVNLQDGKSVAGGDILNTRELIPANMKEKNSTIYLFLPIFNRKYLHGYYVSKNFTHLLDNKSAYNWTRNFGTCIEKFRQTVEYRLISEQLRELSVKDSLSGLLNRTGLDMIASKFFEENNQGGKKTVIAFVDINNMKIINDKFGHLHGDLAIKTVAESISETLPKDFLAIRFGGDEFVIVGSRQREGKLDLCERIKDDLAKRAEKMSLPYNLTVSTGLKFFKSGEKATLLDAIEEVDEMMYKNKIQFHKLG
ncbi:GGDEF domain-containing protein [Treponema sp.]|uniref:GGDEF domain-containing protein n=1 Tax=Treponema sp. TaxID=166 RepID=UPI00298DC31E|nr:GGDEF domain-containing protein [Treponema sp.]MCQ2241667.1 GGDEF domain-containing protein [Treponema sp.]